MNMLVPLSDTMTVISKKWVFRLKYHVDGSIDIYKAYKVRFVTKWFQQILSFGFFDTFSPIIKASTIFFSCDFWLGYLVSRF